MNLRSTRPIARALWCVLAGLYAGLDTAALAQVAVNGTPCKGSANYVVRDMQTGLVVQRGKTGDDGSLGEGFGLGANQQFEIFLFNPGSGLTGSTIFTTGPNGSTTLIPKVSLGTDLSPDSDGDGLSNDAEMIFGFNPLLADSDGDGINDFAAAQFPPNSPNSPPLNFTGIVQSINLGRFEDGSAFDDILVGAGRSEGVFIFNVFDPFNPRLIAQVNTPGDAWAVETFPGHAAVADGPAGFAWIDFTDPANAHIERQVPLGGFATSVAVDDRTAFVGLRPGQVVVLQIDTGFIQQRINEPSEIFDLAFFGKNLFAIAGDQLVTFNANGPQIQQLGSFPLSPQGADPYSGRRRLFVGDNRLWASSSRGFDVFNVQDPAHPIRLGSAATDGPGSFKQILPVSPSLGLGVFGTNPRNDGTHDASLFNLANPANTTALLRTFLTPGDAFGATVYNGAGFIADGNAGLQVLRFLPPDVLGVPPTLTLETDLFGNTVEEGQPFHLFVNAQDDVFVRSVEFLQDGQRVAVDGNYPFNFFTRAPLRSPNRTTITLQARATDTGGNSTLSPPLIINLGPDLTPPGVLRVQPSPGDIVGNPGELLFFFNESVQPSTFGPDSFQLITPGPDAIFGNGNDSPPVPGVFAFPGDSTRVIFRPSSPLAAGHYQARLGPPVADRAGNRMANPYVWSFWVLGVPDQDNDGVPDAIEGLLLLNPNLEDTNGDGVPDGRQDFDNDGLPNAVEILMGLDPRNPNTLNPTIKDGDLDQDGDSLILRREFLFGTDPKVADSDNDGWNDEAEVTAGSDPLNPLSRPGLFITATPPISGSVPGFASGFDHGLFVGYPPVGGSVPGFVPGEAMIIGQPLITGGVPSLPAQAIAPGAFVARPFVSGGMTGLDGSQLFASPFVAQPPVRGRINPGP